MINHKVPTLAFPRATRGEVQKKDKYEASGTITQPDGLCAHIWRFLNSLDTSDLTKQVYRKGLERFEHWIGENNITSPHIRNSCTSEWGGYCFGQRHATPYKYQHDNDLCSQPKSY